MLVLRPITLDDLDQLVGLAQQTAFGLTTLPKDRDLLERRIKQSLRGFEKMDQRPEGETYLFVLEDSATGKVVGTSGINSKVGGFEPFYAYRIETTVRESAQLKVRKQIKSLHLYTEHNGPCEIGSLFLSPDYRHGGNGRLLSLGRFVFMAEHRAYFDPMVIAEMRGVIDKQGRSPFWDAVGSHFFDIDFPSADYLSMINKRFIADLMPKHPIYIPMLSTDAQAVIGQVHDNTAPARKILEREGFEFSGMVDIFEAGPVMICPLEKIRSVQQSVCGQVASIIDEPIESKPFVIANTQRDFRACVGALHFEGEAVTLPRVVALALGVKVGQMVRFVGTRAG